MFKFRLWNVSHYINSSSQKMSQSSTRVDQFILIINHDAVHEFSQLLNKNPKKMMECTNTIGKTAYQSDLNARDFPTILKTNF